MAMKPTKRKVRRFAEGEFIDTESESGEWAGDENYGDGTTRAERVAMARAPGYKAKSSLSEDETSDYGPRGGRGAAGSSESTIAAAVKKAPVVTKEELAKSGLSLRDYMNKQQGLTRRGESSSATAPAMGGSRNTRTGATAGERSSAGSAPAMGGSRNTRTGPSAAELESYSKQQAIKKAMTAPSKEDTQKGLEIMAGAPGLKTIAAAAKGLANRAPAMAEKAREYIRPALAAPTKRLTGPAAKEATDVSPKLLTGPKGAEVSAKGREEVTNPMMWMGGPKNAGKFKEGPAKRSKKTKKALDESDTTGGAVGYKKGGNVRGWGIARGARKAKIV